jgi:MYXO-CTERM domain-containing protein
MKIRSLFAATIVAAAASSTPMVAQAAYVDIFQGVTFTVTVFDPNTLTFRIQNAVDAGPDWTNATQLGAFSFKNLGLDFSAVTATATYTFNSNVTNGVRDELSNSNNDIDCAAQTQGEKGSVCFDFAPDIPLTNDMTFTLDFNANFNIGSTGPHLKIAFLDDAGGKVGSLYSTDIPFSSSSSGSSSSGLSSTSSGLSSTSSGNAPEPNSGAMALLGLGLMAGGFAWRRRANRS